LHSAAGRVAVPLTHGNVAKSSGGVVMGTNSGNIVTAKFDSATGKVAATSDSGNIVTVNLAKDAGDIVTGTNLENIVSANLELDTVAKYYL